MSDLSLWEENPAHLPSLVVCNGVWDCGPNNVILFRDLSGGCRCLRSYCGYSFRTLGKWRSVLKCRRPKIRRVSWTRDTKEVTVRSGSPGSKVWSRSSWESRGPKSGRRCGSTEGIEISSPIDNTYVRTTVESRFGRRLRGPNEIQCLVRTESWSSREGRSPWSVRRRLCPCSGRVAIRVSTPCCKVDCVRVPDKVTGVPVHDLVGFIWVQSSSEDIWVQRPTGGVRVLI